ncbi:MAG TPA: SPOR domain-containing protein [Bacteroidota bacterium]|nr:SPOR domain-containing protein [Bacteroidota bacterium]
MKRVILILFLFGARAQLQAQAADAEVARYQAMLQNGQVEQVRGAIPSLLARYPNNPGVLYIQAQTTSDGAEAVRIYQSIVDNFPASPWAPEALFRVYQFYYALGLYRTAEMKMAQLKKNYPTSRRATGGSGVDTGGLPEDTSRAPSGAQAGEHPAAPTRYALQVGAYTAQANAERQKAFFENLGYSVELISRVRDNQSLYLVLVGSFASADEAKTKGAEIRARYHVESIVTTN